MVWQRISYVTDKNKARHAHETENLFFNSSIWLLLRENILNPHLNIMLYNALQATKT